MFSLREILKGCSIKLKPYDLNQYFPVGGFGDQELERWQIVNLAIKRAQEYYGAVYQKENIYVIGDTLVISNVERFWDQKHCGCYMSL